MKFVNGTISFQDQDVGITAPLLWLATSADRRVSVWSADWSKDFCELIDWLTFPAPAFGPDGSVFQKNDLVRNIRRTCDFLSHVNSFHAEPSFIHF